MASTHTPLVSYPDIVPLTGGQGFMHSQSSREDSKNMTRGRWSKEEDDRLKEAVQRFGGKNWKKIADFMRGRTAVQCRHRWGKVIQTDLVKGPWTPEEDKRLVELVLQHGTKKWSIIAQNLPGRIGKQCRERYHNHLDENIRKDPWCEEEDLVIVAAHHVVGNKWSTIAKILKGRTDNSVKNHWNSTLRRKLERREVSPNEETIHVVTILLQEVEDSSSKHKCDGSADSATETVSSSASYVPQRKTSPVDPKGKSRADDTETGECEEEIEGIAKEGTGIGDGGDITRTEQYTASTPQAFSGAKPKETMLPPTMVMATPGPWNANQGSDICYNAYRSPIASGGSGGSGPAHMGNYPPFGIQTPTQLFQDSPEGATARFAAYSRSDKKTTPIGRMSLSPPSNAASGDGCNEMFNEVGSVFYPPTQDYNSARAFVSPVQRRSSPLVHGMSPATPLQLDIKYCSSISGGLENTPDDCMTGTGKGWSSGTRTSSGTYSSVGISGSDSSRRCSVSSQNSRSSLGSQVAFSPLQLKDERAKQCEKVKVEHAKQYGIRVPTLSRPANDRESPIEPPKKTPDVQRTHPNVIVTRSSKRLASTKRAFDFSDAQMEALEKRKVRKGRLNEQEEKGENECDIIQTNTRPYKTRRVTRSTSER